MNAPGGFICLHRQILRWEWYQDPNTFRLFVHILLRANYADGQFGTETIRRGELVTSLPKLASETQQTIQQVRTALEHLKSTGEITDRKTNRYRVITIVKYNDYQLDNRQNNRQTTGCQQAEQQANQHQYKNNKKDIDDDDINNILNLSPGEAAESIRLDQEIEDAARNVGLTVSASAIMKARDLADRYGHINLLNAIDAAVDVPKWSYVEGILRNGEYTEKDAESDTKLIENTLRRMGRWDEEYGCEKDKAEGYRQRGMTPEEARDDMEARRRRFVQGYMSRQEGLVSTG